MDEMWLARGLGILIGVAVAAWIFRIHMNREMMDSELKRGMKSIRGIYRTSPSPHEYDCPIAPPPDFPLSARVEYHQKCAQYWAEKAKKEA